MRTATLVRAIICLALFMASPLDLRAGRLEGIPPRPDHTYSIVARDPATGQMGVAVQSHWFSVGSRVVWAQAGVGAVATQSFTNPAYGTRGLELMSMGKSAPEALAELVAADEHPEVRQVAMIDAQGRVGAHTGESCIAAAGHKVGSNYSVQANLMTDKSVWPAMSRAFEETRGDLAARLMAALEAAQDQGGDIRGRQSAAILIVRGESTGKLWEDRILDLRVEDHLEPVKELRRLVNTWRAYEEMNAGDDAVTEKRGADALRHYAAAEKMYPGNDEFVFWHAVALVDMGKIEEALPVFGRAFRLNPSWLVLVDRLPPSGLLPDDPALLERIKSMEPKPR
jgi:uncharacterized Ntn-hydrolase superfamily protein